MHRLDTALLRGGYVFFPVVYKQALLPLFLADVQGFLEDFAVRFGYTQVARAEEGAEVACQLKISNSIVVDVRGLVVNRRELVLFPAPSVFAALLTRPRAAVTAVP